MPLRPALRLENGRMALAGATPGASIAYSLDGTMPERDRIYTGPFAPPPGAVVSARAIRYGHAPSEAISQPAP
ncbi:chitobiase/beta-hexosaminidase C-terminal domain-containing protein [Erythrobacter sp. NFXS35]|uniref:chitobiase/beta-hexosaminidase C-terminal domain-containing protein n=1 Tax=Erythrobacter sp. NFXS35 TaxID=2818436 RepID=UPI0032DF51DA